MNSIEKKQFNTPIGPIEDPRGYVLEKIDKLNDVIKSDSRTSLIDSFNNKSTPIIAMCGLMGIPKELVDPIINMTREINKSISEGAYFSREEEEKRVSELLELIGKIKEFLLSN